MEKTYRKRYSAEFKAQAIELVKLGKPVTEVARELSIGSAILYRWTFAERNLPQAAQLGSEGLGAVGEQAEADELRRLRREITHLRLENDILKKAAVILGTEQQPPSRHAG
jgi:transposase